MRRTELSPELFLSPPPSPTAIGLRLLRDPFPAMFHTPMSTVRPLSPQSPTTLTLLMLAIPPVAHRTATSAETITPTLVAEGKDISHMFSRFSSSLSFQIQRQP